MSVVNLLQPTADGGGDRYVRPVTLINLDELLASGLDFADRCLEAYTEDDLKVVPVFAAFSLEHPCKAFLHRISPALLAEANKDNQFDSMLHLLGHEDKANGKFPRTIGAKEAINRANRLSPELGLSNKHITALINMRDGVVHAGHLEQSESHHAFAAYLRAADGILRAFDIKEADRWGRHREFVELLISQSIDEIRQRVKEKIASARARFELQMMNIAAEQRAFFVGTHRQSGNRASAHGQASSPIECPACSTASARYIGRIELQPPHEVDPSIESHNSLSIRGEGLLCTICELRLVGFLELDAAKIPRLIPYEPNEPPYEEDYEIFEGRHAFIREFDDPNYQYDYEYDSQVPYHPEDEDLEEPETASSD